MPVIPYFCADLGHNWVRTSGYTMTCPRCGKRMVI